VTATHLAEHHLIGISTGVFAEARGDWSKLVDHACRVSTVAVELSALSGDELPDLVSYLRAKPSLPFRYVSVHTPVQEQRLDDACNARLLDELPLTVRSLVMHPDTLTNLDPYRTLGARVVLENMDYRKVTGRVADELELFFEELPEAGFCLDIAHAHSIDPTLVVARELLDRFPSRVRQVHLSSLRDGHHQPVDEADELLFADVLDRCRDAPWILEALPPERWLRT
jgi:hypothetical protein